MKAVGITGYPDAVDEKRWITWAGSQSGEKMKTAAAIFMSWLVMSAEAGAASGPGLQHCKDHPHVMAPCFWFRGRLENWNGAPTMRIARFGTKRILGVTDGYASPGYWQVPVNLQAVTQDFDTMAIADFEYCPFTPERAGWMRLGCVETAKNVLIRRRD